METEREKLETEREKLEKEREKLETESSVVAPAEHRRTEKQVRRPSVDLISDLVTENI